MNHTLRSLLKTVTVFLCCSLLMVACKKHTNEDNNSNVIPTADTLSAGWTKVGNIPSTETVSDIFFTDQSNGYITTFNGVYKTSDGGSNWTKIIAYGRFINIAARGARACFVRTTDSIYTTLDYGATFSIKKYTANLELPNMFGDCFYSSDDICYAASNQYVWKSTNGGISFDTIYHHSSSNAKAIAAICFIDDMNGWISTGSQLLGTNNGGLSWTNIVGTGADAYVPVSFLDVNNGFWAQNQGILKTTNGGSDWQQFGYKYVPGGTEIDDIQYFTTLKAVVASGSHIYSTSDGGNTWTAEVSLGGKSIFEVHFLDEHHGWACGTNGYILRFNQ